MSTTPTLDQAIETLRRLPKDRQEEWAKRITDEAQEQAYFDARTLQGLEEAKRGEGIPAEDLLRDWERTARPE